MLGRNKSKQIAGRWICFTAALKYHPYLNHPHPRQNLYFSHLYKLLWMVVARLIPYGAGWSTQSVQHPAVQCHSPVNCILRQCIEEQCFALGWRTFPVESTLQSVEDGCGLTLASNHAILLFEYQD